MANAAGGRSGDWAAPCLVLSTHAAASHRLTASVPTRI